MIVMHERHLRGVDLNLLTLLDALLTQGSVGRAAVAMHLSQPAMSRALGRLRALFGDPLLIRLGATTQLTPRAVALAAPVRRLLAETASLIAPADFTPAEWDGVASLVATDHQAILLLPALAARLHRDAPRLAVELQPFLPAQVEQLRRGDLHLGISLLTALPAGFAFRPLYQDRFVTLMRADHPAAAGPLTVERFAGLDHALVTVGGDGPGVIDTALAARGLRRRVAVRQPHFYAALAIAAQADLVVTLPATIADRFASQFGLIRHPAPVAGEPFTIAMIWSETLTADPAQQWLRDCVVDATRESGLSD